MSVFCFKLEIYCDMFVNAVVMVCRLNKMSVEIVPTIDQFCLWCFINCDIKGIINLSIRIQIILLSVVIFINFLQCDFSFMKCTVLRHGQLLRGFLKVDFSGDLLNALHRVTKVLGGWEYSCNCRDFGRKGQTRQLVEFEPPKIFKIQNQCASVHKKIMTHFYY